jgi:hypothetical protein
VIWASHLDYHILNIMMQLIADITESRPTGPLESRETSRDGFNSEACLVSALDRAVAVLAHFFLQESPPEAAA